MARRTEVPTRPDVGGPDLLPPPGAGEKEGPFWLGWIALAIVLAAGVGLFVYMSTHPGAKPAPVSNPPPAASPSAPSASSAPITGGVPATTYADFAALPGPQQIAVMQQVIDHYGEVVALASRTLDPNVLPRVATGAQLQALQKNLQPFIQYGHPVDDRSQAKILHLAMSPAPYSFVSIDVQATGTDQYLDPKTLQPIGTPKATSGRSSFSFVIEDGIWKAGEHIQEPSS